MKVFLKFFVLFLFINCSEKNSDSGIGNNTLSPNLGISFPPVEDESQRDFTLPLLNELNVDIIRIGENWSFREPTQGNFNWTSLDNRINWATTNNKKVLLTIQSNGPTWACNTALQNQNSCVYTNTNDFKNYIETLLQRYANKIYKIQFGNEWMSDFWYIGNGLQFTTANNIVYNAVQQYSPETKVVLGGFTTISLRFLAGCNGLINSFYDDEGILYNTNYLNINCNSNEFQTIINKINYVLENANYDEVDIHLYDDAENWSIYYNHIKTLVQKPIIVTEFGGPNVNIEPQNENYQSDRLKQYILALEALNIEEAYFFKLVEGTNNPAHTESGLIDNPSLTKKQSYFTFKALNN